MSSKFLTREKLLEIKNHRYFPLFAGIVTGILLLDLLFLNYQILFRNGSRSSEVASSLSTQLAEDSENTLSTSIPSVETCGDDCMNEIDKAVSEALSKQSKTVTTQSSSSTKEYYIPFGSGASSVSEMQDVAGLQAYIDKSAYGSIKKVTFEASVRVPTGNQTAEVQLFNVTAGHPVWFSNVIFTGGGTPQLLVSQPITLDSGNNLYKVQMKTQLKYPAYLDQARVHIITN